MNILTAERMLGAVRFLADHSFTIQDALRPSDRRSAKYVLEHNQDMLKHGQPESDFSEMF